VYIVPATSKKIRRRRPPGEISVEQTHDAAVIAAMLDLAGTTVPADFTDSAECFLMAYLGDNPAGIAGLETEVDAALMRPLFVLETMRRRGVGASLVRAVRVAAHARGARTLYATARTTFVDYFARFGFAGADFAELVKALGQVSIVERPRLDDVSECRAVRLDISRDGLIER
jgi:N-acetylglutamate synthase-like GNAT family acetyltransferase